MIYPSAWSAARIRSAAPKAVRPVNDSSYWRRALVQSASSLRTFPSAARISAWLGVGGGMRLAAPDLEEGIFDLAVETTATFAASDDVRLGAWLELRTDTFRSFDPALGTELLVMVLPRSDRRPPLPLLPQGRSRSRSHAPRARRHNGTRSLTLRRRSRGRATSSRSTRDILTRRFRRGRAARRPAGPTPASPPASASTRPSVARSSIRTSGT
jgi:hypothetical protein